MKRTFLITLGVVLALAAIIGIIQGLMFLVAIIGAGETPGSVWYLLTIGSAAFGIAAAVAFHASWHAPPARHWGLSLTGVLLGIVVGAILKAGLSVLIAALLA
jgi:hypothetical protein